MYSCLNTCYRAMVIKTVWYWHRADIDQWDRVESPEVNLYTFCQLISNNSAKTIQLGKSSFFLLSAPG